MQHFLLTLFLSLGIATSAQLYWSPAIPVASAVTYGDIRGRIVTTTDGVGVLWSKGGGKVFFAAKGFTDNQFATPIQLSPDSVTVSTFTYGGSDIAARGNTLFVVYMTEPFLQAEVYITSSTDGGQQWSNPVHIPLPDSIIPFLPTVAIDDNGNPKVLLMAYDDNYQDPQYAVISSADGGQTFGNLVYASALAPHEVCDCCPAHLMIQGDTVVALFRNNDQNLRDFWAAISFDGGQSFASAQDIDPGNWMISVCPSSGPDGFMANGRFLSTWMNAGSGRPQIYVSEMDLTTQTFTSSMLHPAPAATQNYPRIAGRGDTVGVLFRNSVIGENSTRFTYSFVGIGGLGNSRNVAEDTTFIQFEGDIAFANGQFHIIYREVNTKAIQYRIASTTPVGLEPDGVRMEPLPYPNPTTGTIYLGGIQAPSTATVYNLQGRLLQTNYLIPGPGDAQLSLEYLPQGVYVLTVEQEGRKEVYRVVHQP